MSSTKPSRQDPSSGSKSNLGCLAGSSISNKQMDFTQTDRMKVQKQRSTRKRFKWNRPLKDSHECVWDSDESDTISVPGKSRKIRKDKAKRIKKRREPDALEDNGILVSDKSRAIDGKKRKRAKWNRRQKGAVECGWDSDTILDE